jgi:hypothetical protein
MSHYVNSYAKANRLEIRDKLKAAIMRKWRRVYSSAYEANRYRLGAMAEEAAYGILRDGDIEIVIKKRSG